jgi:uncharacterized protein YabN with tetrapyrrole methylase and pyrophosphatase domain
VAYIWRMVDERNEGLAKNLPSLARAQRVTEWASTLGFDWPEIAPVWKKVEEEIEELRIAAASGDSRRIQAELGDLFFSIVNLSRFLHVEAEDALGAAVERFLRRFAHVEAKIKAQGKDLGEATLAEMDLYWEEAKRLESK